MSTLHSCHPRLDELEGRTLLSAALLADIVPGSGSSDPRFLTNVNSEIFFTTNNDQLWKSDGTTIGTVLVKDINPSGSSALRYLANVNGTLFLSADDGTHGQELWKSDGTAAGTVLVKDINPGSASASPGNGASPIVGSRLENVNGTLFFTADDGTHGVELWKSDGTAAGTVLVDDINPTGDSNPSSLANVSGVLFFNATDVVNGSELWKTDGTAAGTVLVKDIYPGAISSSPTYLTNMNGTLFFRATDTDGSQLWKSDGTDAGTVPVINPPRDASGSSPQSLTNVAGVLFFTAVDKNKGRELWKSDGTDAGTFLVKDIRIGTLSSNISNLTNVNGTLFFSAMTATVGYALWKSDGTDAGTVLVKDIYPGAYGPGPNYLTNVNGVLFFSADNSTNGQELWQSDGTDAGTVLVKDIFPGSSSSNPSNLLNVGSNLYFQANDGTHGTELWKADATTTTDTSGANITSATFSGTASGTFDKVRLTFSEAINATSFTTADVTLSGPNGAITPTAVTLVSGSTTQFDVTFPVQSVPGIYTITTGVNILDLAGNLMNQNQNAINGEIPADQSVQTGTIGAPPLPPIFAVGNFGGTVRIVNASTGSVISTIRPLDNGVAQYTGLVEVALGDFNGDTIPDLAVAAADPSGVHGLAPTKAGQVFVYDGAALATGKVPTSPFHTFTPFATTDGPAGTTGAYINGLNIAAGDVNGDGTVDLIAGTRGGNGTSAGLNEYGRLVVIAGASPVGTNIVIGAIQKPFGAGYQKGVVVAAGNVDGVAGDEIAVTRGGPVASANPAVQKIKVKVLRLQGSTLTELHLSADGSTAFAPFGSLSGPANAINRDGRVAFVDTNGDGKAELVFSALDPLTNPNNEQVRVGVYSINVGAAAGAATIVSTGSDAGTYLSGKAVVDHAISHVAATGTQQNLALITESAVSGIVYLSPLTGLQTGGFGLTVLNGGISLDGI
ncbi:MAG: hyalin [Planctomycetes bacterium]|nr:hyalin [Planctomycetota bacterium]